MGSPSVTKCAGALPSFRLAASRAPASCRNSVSAISAASQYRASSSMEPNRYSGSPDILSQISSARATARSEVRGTTSSRYADTDLEH